jgi:hypothetical protein
MTDLQLDTWPAASYTALTLGKLREDLQDNDACRIKTCVIRDIRFLKEEKGGL